MTRKKTPSVPKKKTVKKAPKKVHKTKKLKTYRVVWEIDIEAENYKDAARQALAIQRNPESIANIFWVVEYNPKNQIAPAIVFGPHQYAILQVDLQEEIDHQAEEDAEDEFYEQEKERDEANALRREAREWKKWTDDDE